MIVWDQNKMQSYSLKDDHFDFLETVDETAFKVGAHHMVVSPIAFIVMLSGDIQNRITRQYSLDFSKSVRSAGYLNDIEVFIDSGAAKNVLFLDENDNVLDEIILENVSFK